MSLKILEMLISGVVFKTTVVNQILNAELTSVFHFVWKVPWRKIVESGWPLFGLLAKLWRDVQNLVGFDIQKMDSYLVSYLKRIEEPPSLQMSAEAFRHLHVWKTNEFNVDRVGAGSVYLAVADWRRRHEEENSDWWLLVEQARAHLSPIENAGYLILTLKLSFCQRGLCGVKWSSFQHRAKFVFIPSLTGFMRKT
eukprot:gnl/MRDRNA2_/MRDRNA2_83992_c0_seq5.p1 gnl/MRDRNA2_/MRDRNA2_83992_c0~~gnl/MRDRNA2_/MRDRNA2_83992_c0_seq5.p1  ORF type:complete len:210 (+),score=25.88 gnl/MRDRNA2_/MRDRNA2_83992_c0_seq5:44-631(+)